MTRMPFDPNVLAAELERTFNEGIRRAREESTGFRVNLPPMDQRPVDERASLALWNLYLPGLSPAWSWYSISLVHLRDIEGQTRPPTKAFDGATHELIVWANDPQKSEEVRDGKVFPLFPMNLVEQAKFPGDLPAVACADACFHSCLAVQLLPEVQGINGALEAWRQVIASYGGHQPNATAGNENIALSVVEYLRRKKRSGGSGHVRRRAKLGWICQSGDCMWQDYVRSEMCKLVDEDEEQLVYPVGWVPDEGGAIP
jgi:hypothetical protein